MLQPFKYNATDQDVLDAPEGMRAELIDGELYLQPRPRGSHQIAAARLWSRLAAEGPSRQSARAGWVLLPDVEIRIPYTLAPDLSGWRRERFTEPLDSPHFTVIPDWVCEVLSPSTQAYDRGLKMRKYLDRGVKHVWLVDPAERTLEVFTAHEGSWLLVGTWTGNEAFNAEPFHVPMYLAELWEV